MPFSNAVLHHPAGRIHLEEVCKLLRSWLDKGYRPLPVSINVSRMHFNDNGLANWGPDRNTACPGSR
ncbi:MAG: hypothetical protein ACLU98_03350 [Desulfovibrio fairfieldensis]